MKLLLKTFLPLALIISATAQEPSPSQDPSAIPFDQFLSLMRNHVGMSLMTETGKEQGLVRAAQTELIKTPSIRHITTGILSELDQLRAKQRQLFEQARAKDEIANRRQSRASQSNNQNTRQAPPKFEVPFANQHKMHEETRLLTEAAKKSLATRLAQLEAQRDTPEAQRFSLPRTSALYEGLGGVSVRRDETITFEAVSNMEGGIIAFRTVLKRVPRPPGAEGGKYDEVRETLPESYFIKGYTEHVTMGERLRLKVKAAPAVMINGSEYKQYTVVE